MDLNRLDQSVRRLYGQGIASSTLTSYKSGIRQYYSFCSQFTLSPFPLTDSLLCRFVAFLYDRQLSPASIRLYLSSIRFLQISLGSPDPSLANFPQLHYVLRAVKRLNPIHRRPPRLPITPAILRHLFSTWSAPPVSYAARMLWAACCLGFFAFLRAGEFTCPSMDAYDPSMLSPGDIAMNNRANPTSLSVSLRHSKTDVFGAGVTLYVGATGGNMCPVAAILSYMAVRPDTPGQLFIYHNNRPLSRDDLVTAVRDSLSSLRGLEVSQFNGHSFRIGAATTAAQVGISDSLIQTLGRWKSSAFLSYIHTPQHQLTGVSRLLLS